LNSPLGEAKGTPLSERITLKLHAAKEEQHIAEAHFRSSRLVLNRGEMEWKSKLLKLEV
jgi:hypothetical protein